MPGPGEVVVALRAASLNHRDLLTVRGTYNPRQPLPLVPGSDGAGEVLAVGPGVTRVEIGDRVCSVFAPHWIAGEPTRERIRATLGGPLPGTLAERILLPAESVVRVPAHLDDVEAATLPCAAVTAWNAVVTLGRVVAGEVVLVLGTGGVSLFALQFARMLGAEVIVTSSSHEKLRRAQALGAVETIHYLAQPEWGREAARLAGGGVDLVVEVGGAGTLAQSVRALRPGGRISMVGALSPRSQPIDLIPIVMSRLTLQGVLVGSRESFEQMNRAIVAHQLRPIIDRVFDLGEAPAALEYLASGAHFGKIGIRIR